MAAGSPQPVHRAVLADAVLRWLDPRPGEVIVDGTVGLGGHAAVLAPRIAPGGRYLGLDLDPEMLARAGARLAADGVPGVELYHANYADFPAVLAEAGLSRMDHMLLDLGVNSAQLDDPARGFSFERDGPLDMRYDRATARPALELVNALSERELSDLFWEYGQEGQSRKIARRICQVRHEGRIATTLALARIVESVVGRGEGGPGRTHPATRVFQALRIAVNRELEHLARALEQVADYMRPGGKLAVISFHSLEDGLVKRYLRSAKTAGKMQEITPRPEVADARERQENRRSRSAKLRVAQRLAPQA